MVSASRLLFGSLLTFGVSARADGLSADSGVGSNTLRADSRATVVAEQPYKLGERPRAEGAVEASVADELVCRWNAGGSSNPACASNRLGYHPAPRVKVDTVVQRGRLPVRSAKKGVLSELGILAQTRNRGYWPFRLCFEAGLRKNTTLAGKTRFRMAVAPDGHVSSSRRESTELRDEDVSACLVTHARSLRFAPAPGRRTEVDVTVDLTPGDAPFPDGLGAHAGEAPDPGPGRLDIEAVTAALTPTLPAISICYAEGRALDPLLWGRVALRFDTNANGSVRNVTQHDTRFPAPSVVGCVLSAVRGIRLPKIDGGPVRFVWALRLGSPPPLETPQNLLSSGSEKSPVAEPPPTRVRIAQ